MAAPDAHFEKLDVGIDFVYLLVCLVQYLLTFFLTSRAITLDISEEGVGTVSFHSLFHPPCPLP